jgi:hypothetical protein
MRTHAAVGTAPKRRASTYVRWGTKAAVLPIGVLSPRRSRDIVVLGYHRVGPGGAEIDMPRGTFSRQLDILAERWDVRSLDDAVRDGGATVLTFDDGTRDFHDVVLPMLVDRRLPAVLYLATAIAEDPEPLGLGPGLTWTMLGEAVATGLVTVGSHTHRHAHLGRATQAEAEDEMRRSKDLIEGRLGVPCRHFAYPWGIGSPIAERLGRRLFETQAVDGWRTNRWGAFDPHRLGRTPVLRSDGTAFFRLKVRGILDAERHVYRLLRRGPWSLP